MSYIAGVKPQCGWLGHVHVGLSSATAGPGPKSVHSSNERSLIMRCVAYC